MDRHLMRAGQIAQRLFAFGFELLGDPRVRGGQLQGHFDRVLPCHDFANQAKRHDIPGVTGVFDGPQRVNHRFLGQHN